MGRHCLDSLFGSPSVSAERTKNEKEGNRSPVRATAVDPADLAIDLVNITGGKIR